MVETMRSAGAMTPRQGGDAKVSDNLTAIRARNPWRGRAIIAGAIAVVIAAIALDTHVVEIGSEADLRQQGFNPDAFGQEEFPRIRIAVEERAVNAPQLAAEIAEDRDGAIARHGAAGGSGAVMPVRFTGVVGEGRMGVHAIEIEGMPEDIGVRLQTGPAITGTDLRDATGDIAFGQFRNQIEFQNAGSAINRAMAAEILSGLDRDTLEGSTVTVTGVFRLVNPANWLVTPTELVVQ